MSVKHIEYLQVKDSKLLVVEVRPVKCLLDTPSGPTYTDKWMEHSHWKELRHLLMDVVDEYEEQKAKREVKCNLPKCKTGGTIQVGYMFRHLPSCWCSLYFLTPRKSCIWTENDDDSGELQDKGGRFEDLVACGEMLVISVILRDPAESSAKSVLSQSPITGHQQTCFKKLIKALDSNIEYSNSISDYFNAPSVSGKDSSSKSVSASSGGRKSSPARVKAFSLHSCNEECKKINSSSTVGQDVDGNCCHTNESSSTHIHLTWADQNSQEKRIEKDDIDSEYNDEIFCKSKGKKTQQFKKSWESKNFKCSTPSTVKGEHRDLLAPETKSRNSCFSGMKYVNINEQVHVHGNLKDNSETLEAGRENKTEKEFREVFRENIPAVPCVSNDDDHIFFTEVEEEVDLDSENHHYDCRSSHGSSVLKSFSQYPSFVQWSDAQNENIECEAHCVSWLDSSLVSGSGEENRTQNVMHNDNLSEKVKENVEDPGESVRCISPESALCDSLRTVPSPSEDDCVYLKTIRELEDDPLSIENFQASREGESSYRTDREYTQQTDVRKKEQKKLKRCSSSSNYIPANSLEVEGPFLFERIEKQVAESLYCTHVSKGLHSYIEKGDGIPKKMKRQVQQNSGMLTVTEKQNRENVLEKYPFHTSVDEQSLQKIRSKTVAPQESLLQNKLMSQVINIVRSSHVNRESHSADEYPMTSQNCADIQSTELKKESSQVSGYDVHSSCQKMVKETHPASVAPKSTKCHEEVTQLNLDKDHSENEVVLDTPSQYSSWPEMEHGNGKVKLTVHRNLTGNLETSPKLEPILRNMKYPSQANRTLFSAEDAVIEGNEAGHHTQVFKSLNLAVGKRKHKPEKKQLQVQSLEASDLSSIKVWDISDYYGKSVEEENPRLLECLSPEESKENSIAESLDVNVDCCSTTECLQSPQNCSDVQSPALQDNSSQNLLTCNAKEANQCTSYQGSVEKRKTSSQFLRSMRFLKVNRNKKIWKYKEVEDGGRLDSENQGCQGRHIKEIKKRKEKLVQSYVNEVEGSLEMPSSVLSTALIENKSQAEKKNLVVSCSRTEDPSLEEWYCDDLPAHHKSTVDCSGPEICDGNINWQLEDHGYEPQTNTFNLYPKYSVKKQKNANSAPITAGLYDKGKEYNKWNENKMRSDISSTHHSNQSEQTVRSWKDDVAADSSDADEPESRMKDHASPYNRTNEQYAPKRVTPRGLRQCKWNMPVPEYVPTNKKILSLAKRELFLDENLTTMKKDLLESDHSTQDLMEEDSAKFSQKDACSITSKSNSMSEECISPKMELSESEESEQIMNLRRSKRIKRKAANFSEMVPGLCEGSDEDSSSNEWCSKEKHISADSVRSKGYSHIAKSKENSAVLKQPKIVKYMKSGNTSKKPHHKTVQLSIPDEENGMLMDQNEKQEDSSKQCKFVKNKKKKLAKHCPRVYAQEISTKASTSKHSEPCYSKQELSSKTQASKKKADLKYYNDIWNFSFPDEDIKKKGKKSSNTAEQKGNKSTPKKTHHAPSKSPSKKGAKRKQELEKKSKSDVENCAPDAIDDDFYWLIQAETEKLGALMNDSDDTLGSMTSSDGNPRNSSKSRSKKRHSQDQRNSLEDDCLILNETAESTHSLDSLRSSYKLLHNMTKRDLEQRLDENIPYLEQVIRGAVPNERHELYRQSSHDLRLQQDYLIYGPFTSEQSLYVLDLLKKKLSHMDRLIGDAYDLLTYRCRVLVPTFFTKIVMDNENVTLREAYRLMAKFTLNKEIADDLQTNEEKNF